MVWHYTGDSRQNIGARKRLKKRYKIEKEETKPSFLADDNCLMYKTPKNSQINYYGIAATYKNQSIKINYISNHHARKSRK